jgi:hypothetical protein
MKCATLLGLAIVLVSITAVRATQSRAECLSDMRELGITPADAKRVCDPKNKAKPNEFGWLCEGGEPFRVKGQGARLKRDALCE